jgi:hypothetical protein
MREAINLDQTNGFAVASIIVVGLNPMSEISVYTIERDAWSIARHREMHFRLTYEREFLPVQNLWRDFLVHSDEIGLALVA